MSYFNVKLYCRRSCDEEMWSGWGLADTPRHRCCCPPPGTRCPPRFPEKILGIKILQPCKGQTEAKCWFLFKLNKQMNFFTSISCWKGDKTNPPLTSCVYKRWNFFLSGEPTKIFFLNSWIKIHIVNTFNTYDREEWFNVHPECIIDDLAGVDRTSSVGEVVASLCSLSEVIRDWEHNTGQCQVGSSQCAHWFKSSSCNINYKQN